MTNMGWLRHVVGYFINAAESLCKPATAAGQTLLGFSSLLTTLDTWDSNLSAVLILPI